MAAQRVLECSFLIPLNGDTSLSPGEPHSITEWEWLTDQLWIGFGGGTIPQCFYEGFAFMKASTLIPTAVSASPTGRGSLSLQSRTIASTS